MSWEDRFTPVDLAKTDAHEVVITWADGAVTKIAMDTLRARCPCAGCVDEWTGALRIRPEDVEGVTVKSMTQVGNYAFSATFSDGHATGIFTYKRLREMGEGLASE